MRMTGKIRKYSMSKLISLFNEQALDDNGNGKLSAAEFCDRLKLLVLSFNFQCWLHEEPLLSVACCP